MFIRQRARTLILLILALVSTGALATARPPSPSRQSPAVLARLAVADNTAVSQKAVAALRALGPAGLQSLYDTYAADLNTPKHTNSARWRRICAAMDAVGQQYDCAASRLYWYTDLTQAEAEARAAKKPILSLRLLGRLNEEYSCANSRFFRTALYPNAEVSQYLRDHYILHWKSERPVPRITIDFGDGRKIVRTLTGNSIHYVLDSEGRPIDALPGLYGPAAFLRELRRDTDWAAQLAAATDRSALLKSLHQARLVQIDQEWQGDSKTLRKRGILAPTLPQVLMAFTATRASFEPPAALAAAPLAISKFSMERPLVSNLTENGPAPFTVAKWDPLWQQLSLLHSDDARLDSRGLALMTTKYPGLSGISAKMGATPPAPLQAVPNPVVSPGLPRMASRQLGGFQTISTQVASSQFESLSLPGASRALAPTAATTATTPLQRIARFFESSMAQDTVRNEYLFHTLLHQWFISGDTTGNLETLNRRVYTELFLTPRSDPWLGLSARDIYTGLPNNGLEEPHLPGK